MDETARKDIAREYEYHASGNVNPDSIKGPGKQTGADFFLRGEIASDTHAKKRKKVQWYLITLKLTSISTGEIFWQDDEEIKKYTRKPRLGW